MLDDITVWTMVGFLIKGFFAIIIAGFLLGGIVHCFVNIVVLTSKLFFSIKERWRDV